MVASEIPNTWWLTDKSCLHMLAFMVHRKNVEFSNLVTIGNAPLTREMQCIRNVEDTVRERQQVWQIVSAQAGESYRISRFIRSPKCTWIPFGGSYNPCKASEPYTVKK